MIAIVMTLRGEDALQQTFRLTALTSKAPMVSLSQWIIEIQEQDAWGEPVWVRVGLDPEDTNAITIRCLPILALYHFAQVVAGADPLPDVFHHEHGARINLGVIECDWKELRRGA